MKTITSITLALPLVLASKQYEVIIPVGPVDLVNDEPLVGRFEDSVWLQLDWGDLRSAAYNGTPIVSVEGRRYKFDVLNRNGTFMLVGCGGR
jgi:hypothetical protein